MIKYSIFETKFRDLPKFVGRVGLTGILNREDIIGRMLALGSTLTRPDIVAVFELFGKAIVEYCGLGFKINIDGLFQITPAVGGTFTGKGDTFTPPRNEIFLTAQISRTLNRRIAAMAVMEKISPDTSRPILYQPLDSEAEPGANALTVGNIVSLKGRRLKFDPREPGEYLRMVNDVDSTQFVQVTRFHKMTDKELVFRLPRTDFSSAYFEVASSLGTTKIRIGRSESFAVVAS